ncbi:MAG: preprotein translocase subunit SecA [bacterium]
MGIFGAIKGIFDYNAKEIERIGQYVDAVNALDAETRALDDEALRAKTADFRERLSRGDPLDGLVPEAFAVVREAADRRCMPGGLWSVFTWNDDEIKANVSDNELRSEIREVRERLAGGESHHGILLPASFYERLRRLDIRNIRMRPFDVQVIGGVVLHEGKIAEMKTGEGKTLAATMPVYLNALAGNGVHIVTVNDYLARRDRHWMGPIYESLGLTVGVIQHDMNFDERREAYNCDVTYGTNNEFGFDYLRDNMVTYREHMVQRGHHYAIVDEVDSILVDEARTPLIISGQAEQSTELYYRVDKAMRRLIQRSELYEYDEKEHTANLTEGRDGGQGFVARTLNLPDLFDWGRDFDYESAAERDLEKMRTYNEIKSIIQASLKAYTLYKADRDYIVKDGEVIIVDEFTGRLMYGRRYSEGLHQCIEAKENVRIEHESQTLASITFQNYFRMYEKLAGMTGTAKTEEQEFVKIYGLQVVVIPTHLPMVRTDNPDVIYKTEAAKFRSVADEIAGCHKRGQPVLVGTVSVEKSEMLSNMLLKRNIPHSVLNAKHHEKEAEIVALAGRKGQVTISTNMAGRGTDIKLGAGVVELGGLHIIGTERHEARRIDNQLRGRSGRQGDPGSSRFYLSLEDDLMRLFGSDRIKGIMERLGFDDSQPIEHRWVTKSIESAQKKVEARNFEIRKHVLEYDDVMNKQRETVYSMRRKVLEGGNISELIADFVAKSVDGLLDAYCPETAAPAEWQLDALYEDLKLLCYGVTLRRADLAGLQRDALRELTAGGIREFFLAKEKRFGGENMREMERVITLRTLDEKWIDHLYDMDHLKDGIGLRAYGQVNPLVAYQKEAFDMFETMKQNVRRDVVRLVTLMEIVRERRSVIRRAQEQAPDAGGGDGGGRRQSRAVKKIGRNDPCPCGSGLKYKKCCARKEQVGA